MNCSQLSPELEQLVTTLFAENKCACHVINSHKTRILMWKKTKDNQTTYHLRIGIQKFTSQEQTDRQGETYWRYYSLEPKREAEQPEANKEPVLSELPEIPTPSPTDPITKFQHRQSLTEAVKNKAESKSQAQAINHVQANESNVTEPQSS